MKNTTFPLQLAVAFSRRLRSRLKEDVLEEINRRNSLPTYVSCCASHDFCDPNQAMNDALQELGLDFHPILCDQINVAWTIAKDMRFRIGGAK